MSGSRLLLRSYRALPALPQLSYIASTKNAIKSRTKKLVQNRMAGNRKFKAWLKNCFSPRATLGLAWVILYSVVYTAVPSAATTMKFSRWKFNIAVVCFWDEFRINFWCICRFHFGIGYSLAGRESPAAREMPKRERDEERHRKQLMLFRTLPSPDTPTRRNSNISILI